MESMEFVDGMVAGPSVEGAAEEGAEVVQIIMDQGGDEQLGLGGAQIIQLDTGEGHVQQYLQVVGANGTKQLIQMEPGQMHYVVETPADSSSHELLQITPEPPAQLTEEPDMTQESKVTIVYPNNDEVNEESNDQKEEEVKTEQIIVLPKDFNHKTEVKEEEKEKEEKETESGIETGTETTIAQDEVPVVEKEIEKHKEIDLSSPIALTTDTVVVINGKKCLLKLEPGSQTLSAFPLKGTASKRPRGRPRKTPQPSNQTEEGDDQSDKDKETSAVEGLLGLSELDDGRRKSNRVRKKNHLLTDYETGPIDGADDDNIDKGVEEGDTPKRGRGRPPKAPGSGVSNQVQNFLANLGLPVKRGRGRPRRRPLSGGASVPAFVIPSGGGQAVMMAPVQGVSMAKSMSSIQIQSLTPAEQPAVQQSQFPIILRNEDGTETHIYNAGTLPTDATSQEGEAEEGAPLALADVDKMINIPKQEESNENPNENESTTETAIEESVTIKAEDTTVWPTETPVTQIKEEQNVVTSEVIMRDNQQQSITVSLFEPGTSDGGGESKEAVPPAAIIQVPQHLLPLLIPRKEPARLGLRASQEDLAKLKCPKCDFQAYYDNQFREHILQHEEDIHKCKCCNFVTIESSLLYKHYNDFHPRNICSVCNFVADHVYIIKRHMARHSEKGSECEICGKVYKDQYVLKMHIKMVHMPAEVLFECNICGKKFTRRAHLNRHLRIHDPEKPFKCPHCEYRGCEKSDITKHITIHEAPKYVCEICNKAFRHQKNKDLHVKRHKGQKDYKCGVCDFYGYTFTDIRKHIERKHSDTRHLYCANCLAYFKNETTYKEHCKTCEIEGAGDLQAMVQAPTATTDDAGHILVETNPISGIAVEQVHSLQVDQVGNLDCSQITNGDIVAHIDVRDEEEEEEADAAFDVAMETGDQPVEMDMEGEDVVEVYHDVQNSSATVQTIVMQG